MSLFAQLAQASADFNFNSSEFDPLTTTTTTTVDPAAAIAIGIGALMIMLVVSLLSYVFFSICLMKIFKKAGRHDAWAAWIPIYNAWVTAEISGRPGWWALLSMIPVVNIIITILIAIDLVKSFGKSTVYVLLLIFVPIIGYPMLAFGDATYQGPAGPEKGAMPPATPAGGSSMPPTTPTKPTESTPTQQPPTQPTVQ